MLQKLAISATLLSLSFIIPMELQHPYAAPWIRTFIALTPFLDNIIWGSLLLWWTVTDSRRPFPDRLLTWYHDGVRYGSMLFPKKGLTDQRDREPHTIRIPYPIQRWKIDMACEMALLLAGALLVWLVFAFSGLPPLHYMRSFNPVILAHAGAVWCLFCLIIIAADHYALLHKKVPVR